MFVPSKEEGILVLKLENGYNIGLEKSKILSSKVLVEFKESSNPVQKASQKSDLKKIVILHTGGTVAAKVSYKTGGVVTKFSAEEILALFPELKEIANIETRLISNLLSGDMRFAHYNLMAKEIEKEIKKDVAGIILTHGTDTLHYSAAALAFMLENVSLPVILVGAQRSSDRGSSDAALNLLCAAQFIVKSSFKGVAMCMHEGSSDQSCVILPACKSRKMHTSRRDTFKSINVSPIARIERGNVEFILKPAQKEGKFSLKLFDEKLKIGILKAHPNMFAEEIKAYEKFDGLVLEGTGLGNFPVDKIDEDTKEHEAILKEIEKLAKKIPVVMASQCIFGRVDMNVYGYGRKLQEANVFGNLTDFTPETAFIKLAYLVSNYKKQEIKALYEKDLRGELSKRTEFEEEFI